MTKLSGVALYREEPRHYLWHQWQLERKRAQSNSSIRRNTERKRHKGKKQKIRRLQCTTHGNTTFQLIKPWQVRITARQEIPLGIHRFTSEKVILINEWILIARSTTTFILAQAKTTAKNGFTLNENRIVRRDLRWFRYVRLYSDNRIDHCLWMHWEYSEASNIDQYQGSLDRHPPEQHLCKEKRPSLISIHITRSITHLNSRLIPNASRPKKGTA